MAPTVTTLLRDASQLSDEARIELAERLIEGVQTFPALMAEHMSAVRERMQNVSEGRSEIIPADRAHQVVRDALGSR